MNVQEITDALGLKVYSGQQGMTREVKGGYSSDLLSDVMGNSREGQAWITLQTHRNVMAIASLRELAAIILVKGFAPGEDTVQKSDEEGIPVLGTDLPAFEIAGKLFALLNR